jgi:hypothetical protein
MRFLKGFERHVTAHTEVYEGKLLEPFVFNR